VVTVSVTPTEMRGGTESSLIAYYYNNDDNENEIVQKDETFFYGVRLKFKLRYNLLTCMMKSKCFTLNSSYLEKVPFTY